MVAVPQNAADWDNEMADPNHELLVVDLTPGSGWFEESSVELVHIKTSAASSKLVAIAPLRKAVKSIANLLERPRCGLRKLHVPCYPKAAPQHTVVLLGLSELSSLLAASSDAA